MSNPLAEHLADRFAADGAALRARAAALRPGGPRAPGPSPQSLQRMAEACDRVRDLFAGAADDAAVRALLPTLAGMVAGARDDERAVYAGAVARASQALDGDDADDDEGEEDDG
ncbi:hypothetical protein [Roseisolibacter sp. H3M3-2]|uniref:hypothetical protein n=1 Tax=Roseisolibacter sp. H3M3-2 TaxID=3031323 RepID=UPI0023DB1FC9|nr:hypothetical protein [Roseisolibacter sp. H3M3-2]MDF1503893.1 hypothetical protein [Roseisolibacter sp. H3M3-2]